MNSIIFQHHTVLSDVHMLLPNACHLMRRLNRVGQPVFLSKFEILCNGQKDASKDSTKESVKECEEKDNQEEDDQKDKKCKQEKHKEEEERNTPVVLDEDGDLDVTHRHEALMNVSKHTVFVYRCDLGNCFFFSSKVWRGALLLADFIFSVPLMFKGATILELGAGTGLTSIIMATLAKTVYCTDVGEDLLNMCKKNVTLNKHLIEPTGGEVRVRRLDWLQKDFCTDADVEFSWTEEEIADIHNKTKFIIAADVCYDDDLTDGFFRTLYQLCSNFNHICQVFISIEKRMNFTLRHMDVSCEAYDHFRHCLFQLHDLVDGKCRFRVEEVSPDFPQCLMYERIEQLELWKVTVTPLRLDSDCD
uniref:Methyltransferase like 22 n=1 Tax=Sphaeramia orbicularis TaxID=375764 RepID=A0A673A367_9TELE